MFNIVIGSMWVLAATLWLSGAIIWWKSGEKGVACMNVCVSLMNLGVGIMYFCAN